MTQLEKARLFLELHRTERPLILANAWDVASARIFEEAGFPAIATTSAGIANMLGYADGQRISRLEMLEIVGRIARAVRVPVTADMEAGYGDAAETARGVIAAGAVGFNFEDCTRDIERPLVDIETQSGAIREAAEAGERAGVPLVINARTDVFMEYSKVSPADRLGEAVRRLRAYRQAGASSAFAPGLRDEQTIGELVRSIDLPLNILLTPGCPPVARLRELGVARVSIGSGAMRATMGLIQRIARELRERGEAPSMMEGPMNFLDANKLFLRPN